MKAISVIILWLAGLCAAVQFAKIAVPFSRVRDTYPESGNDIGWLLTIVSLVGAVFGLVASRWVLQLGAKRMLLAGLVIGSVLTLLQSSFPSFSSLLILRTIEGLSHLVIVITAPALIASISVDRYRGLAMSLWSTFFGISFAVVGWFGMPIVEIHGLSFLFQVHGVAMLVIALLVATVVFEPQVSSQAASGRALSLVQIHKQAYSSAWVSAPAAGWFFYTLTYVAMLALLPERLPQQNANLMIGLLPIVSIVVSLVVVPLLLARASAIHVLMLGFFIAIVMLGFIVSISNSAFPFIGLFASLGLVQGASFSAIPELNPEPDKQVLAYGLIAQAGNAGNLIGTPLLLAIAVHAGDSVLYFFIATIYAIAIACHLVLKRLRSE